MAVEAGHPSRYVKLTRNQDAPAAEDIRPGELNQPVAVPQLEGRRCSECGQVLPESYRAPADEPWTTGIFGCTDDPESCRIGLFCPCVLFGRNVQALREDTPWTTPCTCHAVFVEGGIALAILTSIFHGVDPRTSFLIGEGLVFSWWICATYTGLFRQELQRKYHLKQLVEAGSAHRQPTSVYSCCSHTQILPGLVPCSRQRSISLYGIFSWLNPRWKLTVHTVNHTCSRLQTKRYQDSRNGPSHMEEHMHCFSSLAALSASVLQLLAELRQPNVI